MSSNDDAAGPAAVEQANAPERPNPSTRRRSSKARKKTRRNTFLSLRKRTPKDAWAKYAELLAETSSTTGLGLDTAEKYNATQNGIVLWTPHEKELLFHALDRKGKNGITEIATAVGSKSELEVQEHLRLLQTGLERQHLRDRHSRTIILGDVPAATEIRADCDRVLDGYAELLRLEEQCLEDINGRKRHRDDWLIDRDRAEEIEDELDDGGGSGDREKQEEEKEEEEEEEQEEQEQEEQEQEEQEQDKEATEEAMNPIHQTAHLLHLEKWIRLSERFFMNAGGHRLEDNWNNIAYADESPSLTADAFVDFYSLAQSVTRRIVHSALFFAMSRLRRMKNSGRLKAKLVKTRDVRAALGVLNMEHKTKPFWVGLARRCSLDVVDARHVKGWKSVPLDHNQVEDYLSGGVKYSTNTVTKLSGADTTGDHDDDDDDDDDDNDNDDEEEEEEEEEEDNVPERAPEAEPLYLSHEDEHADMLDRKATRLEESKLYQLLEHPIPSDLDPASNPEKSEDTTDLPWRPKGERKTKEDLADWRDRTLYQSEWEVYGRDIFDIHDDLAENRRKRRRIAQDEPSRFASPVSSLEGSDGEVTLDRDTSDSGDVDSNPVKHEAQHEDEEDLDELPDVSDQESKLAPSLSRSSRDGSESDHDEDNKPVLSRSQSPSYGSDHGHDEESKPASPSQSSRADSESHHEAGSDYEHKQETSSNIEDESK